MKKISILGFTLLSLTLLTACGNNTEKNSNSTSNKSSSTSQENSMDKAKKEKDDAIEYAKKVLAEKTISSNDKTKINSLISKLKNSSSESEITSATSSLNHQVQIVKLKIEDLQDLKQSKKDSEANIAEANKLLNNNQITADEKKDLQNHIQAINNSQKDEEVDSLNSELGELIATIQSNIDQRKADAAKKAEEEAAKVDYTDLSNYVTQGITSDTVTFPAGSVIGVEIRDTGVVHVIAPGEMLDMNDDTKMGYIDRLTTAVRGQVEQYNVEKHKEAECGMIYFYTENGIEWAKPTMFGDYKLVD